MHSKLTQAYSPSTTQPFFQFPTYIAHTPEFGLDLDKDLVLFADVSIE